MMTLKASVAIIDFPNPDLSNTESLDSEVKYKSSMNGTPYTYIKSNLDRKLSFTFSNMGLGKLVELQEFQRIFSGEQLTLTDHRSDQWLVIFDEDSISYSTDSRSFNSGGARKEQGSVTLILVGKPI